MQVFDLLICRKRRPKWFNETSMKARHEAATQVLAQRKQPKEGEIAAAPIFVPQRAFYGRGFFYEQSGEL
jgi:hypothetical protein